MTSFMEFMQRGAEEGKSLQLANRCFPGKLLITPLLVPCPLPLRVLPRDLMRF